MMRSLTMTAGSACAAGALYGAAHTLVAEQSKLARRTISIPDRVPPNADGTYLPCGEGPLNSYDPRAAGALRLAIVGDSMAAGLGVADPESLLAVLLCRALAEELGRGVRIRTHAVSGSTSSDLAAQARAAVADSADLALIIVGANDISARMSTTSSVALLQQGLQPLRQHDVGIVMGTCPDMGVVQAIPPPLRQLVGSRSRALSRAQQHTVRQAGGRPVPIADLLAGEFRTRQEELLSVDQFHPSESGYEAAAALLLPALCSAAGLWEGGGSP